MSKETYKVWKKAHADRHLYVRAKSSSEAIEMVTMRLADVEGIASWAAKAESPSFDVVAGGIFDQTGRPMKPVDL